MLRNKAKKKSNFVSSDFILLLVCYLGRLFLYKNARNICVAICFGFRKNIFILTGLYTVYKDLVLNCRRLLVTYVK